MENNITDTDILYNGTSERLPTYIRLMETFRRHIISGKVEPNEKIKSIKELAKEYNVNTNTVQRALAGLEEEGLLRSHRTAGKYVTENKILIKSIRNMEARKITEDFVSKLQILDIKPEELVELFSNPMKVEEDEETA